MEGLSLTNQTQSDILPDLSIFLGLPLEILSLIFSFLDVNTLLNISGTNKKFKSLASEESFWEVHYKKKFGKCFILDSFTPPRHWKQRLADRNRISSTNYEKPFPKSPELFFEYFSDIGEALRKKAEDMDSNIENQNPQLAHILWQVAAENFASAIILKNDASDTYFKYGDAAVQLAKLTDGSISEKFFQLSFSLYEKAATPAYFMRPNVLRYWGDALVDSGKKKEGFESEKLMLMACDKYKESVSLLPNYWMAYYYWGKCLHYMGKNKGKDSEALKYFNEACQKFELASLIRPDDVYLKLEHASTLRDFAIASLTKAEDLFREASIKYSEAHNISAEDPWVFRSWADNLYDHAKYLYAKMLDFPDSQVSSDEIEHLLDEACDKYDQAVKINPKYSNACNSWGLALSTHAKITSDEEKAEMLFSQSYDKFQKAIESRTDNYIEICNWAMTKVSQAFVREKMMIRKYGKVTNPLKIKEKYREAKSLLSSLVEKQDPWSYFCMSRLYASARKEEKSKQWLLKCKSEWASYLKKATRWQLGYFDNVKHTDWYQSFLQSSSLDSFNT